MLSKPENGWTYFQLDGTRKYDLSYLNDIPSEWLGSAICGLETMQPFCVSGYLEPDRMTCTVSIRNCHIVIEEDTNAPFPLLETEYSDTGMLEFCKCLYEDINSELDSWASFYSSIRDEESRSAEKRLLTEKLEKLRVLIDEKERLFGGGDNFV